MKRSIKSDSPAPTESTRLENRDGDGVRTCTKNPANMSLSTPVTNYCLTSLPVEIRADILCHLPDLRALLSTMLVHSLIHAPDKEYSCGISLAIFRRLVQVHRTKWLVRIDLQHSGTC
ncbi:hypothetical protein F4823DRAFT_617074 [Ustulina deusta]|nr:hypothetical protein F4823DRAFT_617074 [Ustulina deusta]